jgi:hypothetical protein
MAGKLPGPEADTSCRGAVWEWSGSANGCVGATRSARAAWLRSVAGLVSAAKCLQTVEAATSAPGAAGHVLTAMVCPWANPEIALRTSQRENSNPGIGDGGVQREDGGCTLSSTPHNCGRTISTNMT